MIYYGLARVIQKVRGHRHTCAPFPSEERTTYVAVGGPYSEMHHIQNREGHRAAFGRRASA